MSAGEELLRALPRRAVVLCHCGYRRRDEELADAKAAILSR